MRPGDRILGNQAAWVYSLIRPLRTGLRRICCLSTSVTIAQGASRSSAGTRCYALVGPGGVVVVLIFRKNGSQVRFAEDHAFGRGLRGAACRRGARRSRSSWVPGPRCQDQRRLSDIPSGCQEVLVILQGRRFLCCACRKPVPPGQMYLISPLGRCRVWHLAQVGGADPAEGAAMFGLWA